MSDRKKLQEELNRINRLYKEYDVELTRKGADINQRQKLRDIMNRKKENVISEMGDDLQKLNIGKQINVGNSTVSKVKDIAGQGLDAASNSKVLKTLGKKAMSVLPFAGAGMAALQGDPAMAAEELAMDLPGAEALRSDAAGMSPEDEKMMLTEIDAQKEYRQSPARMDRIRNLMGRSPAAAIQAKQANEEIDKLPTPDFSGDIPPEKFDEERRKAFLEKSNLRRLLGKQKD